ncbi:MAG TPA: HEAT repeat domain-containing protein [Acidimicrobiales bacterium]|nr:HEAT repeat domain-containing protein [Acidimicrobiales bacterium]
MTASGNDANDRRRAAAMAGHSVAAEGHRPEDDARAFLADPDPAVRATALGALERLAVLEAADLEGAATDPSPVVRARAAELAHDHGTGLTATLVTLLGDGDAQVVEAAAFGLGEFGERAGGDEVIDALGAVVTGHPDAICREAAVAALGAIGAPAGLAAVLAATTDKPAVRRRAVLALAAFEGPEVDAALERTLSDRDWQVRQAAEDLTAT